MILEMWELGYNLREIKDREALYSENDFWASDHTQKMISEPQMSPVIRRLRVRSPPGAQKSFSEYKAWRSLISHTRTVINIF